MILDFHHQSNCMKNNLKTSVFMLEGLQIQVAYIYLCQFLPLKSFIGSCVSSALQ